MCGDEIFPNLGYSAPADYYGKIDICRRCRPLAFKHNEEYNDRLNKLRHEFSERLYDYKEEMARKIHNKI